MAGKEKKQELDWKKLGWSLLGALGIYLLLQLVGAALVSGETVSEEKTALLIGVFAGVSVLASLLVFLRKMKSGRLASCVVVACAFVIVIVLTAVASGSWESVIDGVWVLLTGATAGGIVAALLGGGKKKRNRTVKKR